MTKPPEGNHAPTGSERPPSPLQPPRSRRAYDGDLQDTSTPGPPPTAPPTAPPAPQPDGAPHQSGEAAEPSDFDAVLQRAVPRQPENAPQNRLRPPAPRATPPAPTERSGPKHAAPGRGFDDHDNGVPGAAQDPINHEFTEPGNAAQGDRRADDLRPTAPHLDPRVSHLTDISPPKRRWFGRGRPVPAELPANTTTDALASMIETPRRISVVGLKGGVGKTTSAILLARTIARVRAEPVLLLDSDTTYGSLLLRLGTPPIASAHDIASMGDPGTLDVLRGVIARTNDGVWILPSGRNPAQSAEFGEQTYVAAVRALYRYFPVSVTDCGTGIAGSLMRRVIEASHALVIATSASVDGVLAAHNALDWLAATGHGELASRSIVVMGNVPDQPVINVAETKRGLEQICHAVVCIPTDPAISPGGYIDFDSLQPVTQQAGHALSSLAFGCSLHGGR